VKLSIAAAGCLAGLVIASALASTVDHGPEVRDVNARSEQVGKPQVGGANNSRHSGATGERGVVEGTSHLSR
jgi:hypothetical protein